MAVSPFKLEAVSRLLAQGKFAQAESELLKLGRISPGDPNVADLLTTLFAETGRYEQAAFAAERRAALLPQDFLAQSAVVQMLLAAKKPEEALARARAVFERSRNQPGAVLVLAAALLYLGRGSECAALVAERTAAGIQNDDLRGMRASALLAMGRTPEAEDELRHILKNNPRHRSALSLLATVLNYIPGADLDELFRIHVQYGKEMEKLQPPAPRRAPATSRAPLTVAMLSPDLHEHSVSRFVEPIVRYADRASVRIVLISLGMASDTTSERLASLADAWHNLRPASWHRLAEICTQEKVDVLIELGGHMTNTPLPYMVPRIAGLQGTAIGYPNTTGLPTIDFRIVDSITDPPGESDRRATEKLIRLDPCFLCFEPPINAPDVSRLPAASKGFVTFGSFNAFSKINDGVLADWSELLRRVPGSRLHIKGIVADDPGIKRDIEERAARAGIAPDCLTVLGKEPTTRHHLDRYAEIDIALDPFPYHGTTTTCEALWMGVPVVTRTGSSHASRVGASLLNAVGLPGLITPDRESYLAAATSLSRDLPALASMRAALREQVRTSALCDGSAYARRWAEALIHAAAAPRP